MLDARISDVRRQALFVGLVALPCALLIFYLAGGRQLTRRHEHAVQRSLTDALTGLGNHSAFYETADQHAALALASSRRRFRGGTAPGRARPS